MSALARPISLAFVSSLLIGSAVGAADNAVTVNVDNFVRVENDIQFSRVVKITKSVNKFNHIRLPTPLDKQTVIRMNRDTLYSFAVVDISKGATVTLPDVGKRYMSAMIVNNYGYINKVFHGGGAHQLTMKEFDTPHVYVAVRLLVDSSDEADVEVANKLQDKMTIDAASAQPFKMPNYDMESYEATYKPLLALSKGVPDTKKMFGKKSEVNPVRFLLGTAFGWGGLPINEAYYLNVDPKLPIGKYYITAKDVPVDAFWSVSVYNKEGYFEKNDLNSYTVNSVSGKPNKDGSITVHLGGCGDKRVNCVPLTEGWNYVVRMYQPRKSILDGSWTFPSAKPAK